MKTFALFLAALIPLTACATEATKKARALASDAIPKCWKVYDAKLHDGLYHITIPANDSITAKNVQAMIMSLQAFGVASHTVSAFGSESIILEAQFVTLEEAKKVGYTSQEKLEALVDFVLKNDLPYLDKGVTITCFEEHPLRHH